MNGIAFSSDGKTFASTSADHTVRLWDALTGEERAVLRGHLDWVYGVAFKPDGSELFTVGKDKGLINWLADEIKSSDSSSTSSRLLPGAGAVSRVRTSVIATLHPGTQAACQVAISDDARLLAANHRDGTITIWNSYDWSVRTTWRIEGHGTLESSLTFSPDSQWLAGCSSAAPMRLWNVSTGDAIVASELQGSNTRVHFSRQSRFVAAANEWGEVHVFDLHERAPVPLAALADRPRSLGDGFSSWRMPAVDNRLREVVLWDLQTGEAASLAKDLPEVIAQTTVSADETLCFLLVANYDDQFLKLDAQSGAVLSRFGNAAQFPVTFAATRDAQLVLPVMVEEHQATLWDTSSGQPLAEFSHLSPVACTELSRDGTMAVCGFSDGTVKVWRIDRKDSRTPQPVNGRLGM